MIASLSDQVVTVMLDGAAAIMEDRIDDILAQYPETARPTVLSWIELDPTPRKKYARWIVKQVIEGHAKMPKDAEAMKDYLMAFERLLVLPAYEGMRDLYQVRTFSDLKKIVRKNADLRSKSAVDRERKQAGVQVVAKEGNLTLLKIVNRAALNSWGWKAYQQENPNWGRKTVKQCTEFRDGLWCIRFPEHADNYLGGGPFYLVLKNDGPYVGIVWEKGECQTLDNKGISTAVAQEIYPVVKDTIPEKLEGRCRVFYNLKFLHDEIQPGSRVEGPIELSHTELSVLPDNLTIMNGGLNVSFTPLTKLPVGLTVRGCLNIAGTQVTQLPNDLVFENMVWSEPLTDYQITLVFFRNRLAALKQHYWVHEANAGLNDEQKEAKWKAYQPTLIAAFLKHPGVSATMRTIFEKVDLKGKA